MGCFRGCSHRARCVITPPAESRSEPSAKSGAYSPLRACYEHPWVTCKLKDVHGNHFRKCRKSFSLSPRLCRANIASFLDETSTSRLLVYQDGKELGAVRL